LALVFLFTAYASVGKAATYCVNEQLDDGNATPEDCPPDAPCDGSSGDCSLRDAVDAANDNSNPDIINFSSSLTSPLLLNGSNFGAIVAPLDINGPGSNVLTIDASGSDSVFFLDEVGSSFSISGLTLTGAVNKQVIMDKGNLTISNCVITGGPGGGILVDDSLTIRDSTISNNDLGLHSVGASVTIERSTFSDNTHSSNLVGGALHFSGGSLIIRDSTFSGNTSNDIQSDEGGGAIGIYNSGLDTTAELTNVTISGNRANANGGGLWISNVCGSCGTDSTLTATLTNVTIADNTANLDSPTGTESGGGLYVGLLDNGSSVLLNNVLIADNSGGSSPDCLVDLTLGAEPLASNGFNLVEDPTGCTVLAATDITGEDPLLGALGPNLPGTTETQALDSNSPAINAAEGAPICPPTDQRGVPRPQGSACDIGAYEAVICGDGTEGPGEECENGPCCDTVICQFSSAGTVCNDGTSEGTCDGAGDCVTGSGGCSLGLAGSDLPGPAGLAGMFLSLAAWFLVRRRAG
jgi:hypothetical protein